MSEITITVGEMIDTYINTRDYITQETEEFDGRIKKYKDRLAKMEAWMLEHLQKEGQQSAKSASGNSCFQITRTFVKVTDKTKWFDWLLGHWEEAPAMLTAHVAKDGIFDWRERHDTLPAGVDLAHVLTVQFRKG
jgi:hypothetical protein